jgi:hypothetical protein
VLASENEAVTEESGGDSVEEYDLPSVVEHKHAGTE